MSLTDARYKTKTTLLLVIIIVEVILVASLAILCASLGTSVYSEASFLEISLDGSALQLDDSRKLMEDWGIPIVAQRRFLKTFIQSFRTITSDEDIVTANVGRVVYRTSGQAYQVVTSYLESNQPLAISKEKTVKVPYEDIELTNYGDNKWKIVWREITYSAGNGQKMADKQYEAVVHLAFKQQNEETAREWNPLGIYITYMDSDLLRSYT